jgi:hypothetical protein
VADLHQRETRTIEIKTLLSGLLNHFAGKHRGTGVKVVLLHVLIVIFECLKLMFIELRREVTLLFSFGQIFEQKFTKLSDFLSICQLRFAFSCPLCCKVTKNHPHTQEFSQL